MASSSRTSSDKDVAEMRKALATGASKEPVPLSAGALSVAFGDGRGY